MLKLFLNNKGGGTMNDETVKKPNAKKIILITCLALVGAILLSAIGYIVYVFADYHRIEDNLSLEVKEGADGTAPIGEELTIITYNIGFAAYTPEFSFFMDGGKYSRAESAKSVHSVMGGIIDLLEKENADFLMIEEVDEKATRSHHVDQRELLENNLNGYDSVFAVNYDSPYLFYPFNSPHGKSLSGMLTFSKYNMTSSIRRSLPIETSLMKLVDLDRCYSVSRVETESGKELVLYTVHLSAYTSDGTIATEQLKMLVADMKSEYEKGNYVVCGGDFNKDLLGDSSEYFGVSGDEYTWAQAFPEELLKDTGLSLVASSNSPSCRNADAPYHEGQFVLTVDGFIASDNVTVKESRVIENEFEFSDHNPVVMTFILD